MLSPPNKTNSPGRTSLTTLFILLAWLAALGLIFANRQNLFDWWQLHDYQAPTAVAQIARQDTMTGYGRKVFYVNHPKLESKSTFFNDCPSGRGSEQTIVLGCYHSGQTGIFVQQVDDPRLSGVEQVTAAHEMLHAAYDRLSAADRQRVDKLLLDYYHNGLRDQRILSTIDAYKKTEPNDLVNEMHSIFGTEVSHLPAPLESYYKQYFTDRSRVAAYAAQYQKSFTAIPALVASYNNQLKLLKTTIDQLQADLQTKQAAISARQQQLMAEKQSGNTSAYNAGVAGYNQQVDAYNTELQRLKAVINEYNSIVSKINTLAVEQNQLVKELSSEPQPINH